MLWLYDIVLFIWSIVQAIKQGESAQINSHQFHAISKLRACYFKVEAVQFQSWGHAISKLGPCNFKVEALQFQS